MPCAGPYRKPASSGIVVKHAEVSFGLIEMRLQEALA